jgi:hypothetical protein
LYVVCSFRILMESPSLGIPTPTNGAPPPVEVPVDWLAIPAAEPSVFVVPEPVPELSGEPEAPEVPEEPSVAGPFVPLVVEDPPPSVGMPDDPPGPPVPGDPNALDPDELPNAEP